jgi:hypothetical protein
MPLRVSSRQRRCRRIPPGFPFVGCLLSGLCSRLAGSVRWPKVERTEQRDGTHNDDSAEAKQEPVLNPRQQSMLEPLKRRAQGRDLGVQIVAHWSLRTA